MPESNQTSSVSLILRTLRLGTEQFLRVEREPGFDARPFDALGHLLDQFRRARMQFAPVSLCRKNGIGTPSCADAKRTSPDAVFIIASSRAAPGREELCFVDGALGDPAQRRRVRRAGSMPMNHCVVARKMIGVLWRQQCG